MSTRAGLVKYTNRDIKFTVIFNYKIQGCCTALQVKKNLSHQIPWASDQFSNM